MANVQGGRVNGNIVYFDRLASGLQRYQPGSIGPDVIEVAPNMANPAIVTDTLAGWTTTLVEAGAGESTLTAADASGGGLLITTDAADNDGVSIQKLGEAFEFTTAQKLVYFRAKFQISDATQSDFFVGLAITDTTPLGGVSDGVYFQKIDGAATFKACTEKNATETDTTAVGTIVDATDVTLEFLYRGGTSVLFYVDGVLVATHTANIPDDELLTPTVHFLAGEAVVKTMTISDLFALQIGR